jgi:hypothetical protein
MHPEGQNYLRSQDFHSLVTTKLRHQLIAPVAASPSTSTPRAIR